MPRPFAQQRLVCFALLLGMTVYAIVAAVMLQCNDGKGLAGEPIPLLETIAGSMGAILTVTAILLRFVLRGKAEKLTGDGRAAARFASVLVPLAILEGGCLFATTVWMLTGNAVPSLAVALVMLAIAIALVPFSDPDTHSAR